MSSKSSDRTLVNVIGIPAWLGVIALGGIYYSLFMTVCIAIALWEFYQMAKTKDISPNPFVLPLLCGSFIKWLKRRIFRPTLLWVFYSQY